VFNHSTNLESPKKPKKSEDRSKKKDEVVVDAKKGKDTKDAAKSPRKDEKKNEKDKAKHPELPSSPEPEVDYSNQTGTMIITKSANSAKKEDKKDAPTSQSYVNASGTMVVTPQNLQAALQTVASDDENFANSTGTMVVQKTMKAKEDKFLPREEMESLSTEDLLQYQDTKLEKRYKKECDRILRKWKDEKSAVLYAMRKKEIDVIEQKYQQMQLDLERELQEKKEKI